MTFNEANVNRDTSGKFDHKVGSLPDIALDELVLTSSQAEDMGWDDSISTNADGIDDNALGDIIVTRVDDDMFGVATRREIENSDPDYMQFLTDEYQATGDRLPGGGYAFDAMYFNAFIPNEDELSRADLRLAIAEGEPGRYDRDKETGRLEEKYHEYRIQNTTSPAEADIARLADIHWKGTDSTTPEGTYLVVARQDNGKGEGILYSYLMDDKERTIIGRVETPYTNRTNMGESSLYAGGGVKGGHWMRASDEENRGQIAWHERLVEQRERIIDGTIAEWTRAAEAHPGESMDALEHVIRREDGINILLRNKLKAAYESDNGREEVPRLLRQNAHQVTPGVYSALLRLSEDPNL